jgi:hypothetical protein
LKTITIVPEPHLGAGDVLANPPGTARQSNVAKPATLTIKRMEFSFAITGATVIQLSRANLIYAAQVSLVPRNPHLP